MMLSELYKIDPKAALDRVLDEAEKRHWNGSAHLWRSWMGVDSKTRYGSYNSVSRRILEGRKYEIEFSDGNVAIFFTDELHDPRTYQKVKI